MLEEILGIAIARIVRLSIVAENGYIVKIVSKMIYNVLFLLR